MDLFYQCRGTCNVGCRLRCVFGGRPTARSADRAIRAAAPPDSFDTVFGPLIHSAFVASGGVRGQRARRPPESSTHPRKVPRGLSARRRAFADVPRHLDGTGNVVIGQVALLMTLIEVAAAPLAARHLVEIAEMDERIKAMGERGSGKKQLEERHKRELRRHRTDEIRAGLVAIASTYRDALVAGAGRHATAYQAAVVTVHAALEAMERNPNDTLQMQSLLLRLPPIG